MSDPAAIRAWSALRRTFHAPASTAYRVVEIGVAVLIVLSVVITVLEVSADLTPRAARHLARLDIALLVCFAIEIGLRIATFQPPDVALFERSRAARWRARSLRAGTDHVLVVQGWKALINSSRTTTALQQSTCIDFH